MSKPESRSSVLTWILACGGIGLWAVGTMGWAPISVLHPIAFVLIFVAAVTADPIAGRSSASSLQLTYTVVAWLMVALISVTEALKLGGILFFGLIALTMTVMYFHPSFRLKTRVTLYLFLLATVWAPALYGVLRGEEADELLGHGAPFALLALALVVSAMFFGFTYRWLTVARSDED